MVERSRFREEMCVFDLFKMVINVIACVCVYVCVGESEDQQKHNQLWSRQTDYTCVLKQAQANTMRNAEPRQRKALGATSFSPCLFHTFSAQ